MRVELILENIRSFVGRHEIPIKPLTFLIGENSAGKTTLLAAYNAALDPEGFPGRPPFNQPPYSMGNYRTLATRDDETDQPAEFISLGFRADQTEEAPATELTARYVEVSSQVELHQITAIRRNFRSEIVFSRMQNGLYADLKLAGGKYNPGERKYLISLRPQLDKVPSDFRSIFNSIYSRIWDGDTDPQLIQEFELRHMCFDLINQLGTISPFSIAPLRSPPQRIYNSLDLQNPSTGDGFAFRLIELLKSETQMERLQVFGKNTGLFDRVHIEAMMLGDNALAEVRITHGGVTANLTDVGYGVSQALPLVVSCLTTPKESPILIQQPEVHLHPRAQAALGTFFVEMVQEEGKQFLIETHSDYILDRVRIEVAQGKIPAEDVLFLFLEKRGNRTTVYPMPLDENGNLLDAPPSYGDFFLQEQMRLLQRA